MSSNNNITAVPDPIPMADAPQAAAPVAAVANATTNPSVSAMQLFAPDPNSGTANVSLFCMFVTQELLRLFPC